MDIKKTINEIVDKVKNDSNFAEKFKKNPIKAIEQTVNIDLPDDKIDEIINMVKAKINLDDNKLFNKVKDFFD